MNKFQFVKLFLLGISLSLISCATEKKDIRTEGTVIGAAMGALIGGLGSYELLINFPKSFPFPPPKAST